MKSQLFFTNKVVMSLKTIRAFQRMLLIAFLLTSSAVVFAQPKSIPRLGAEFWLEPHYTAEYIDAKIQLLAKSHMPVVRVFIGLADTVLVDNAFAAAKKYGVKVQLTFTVPEDPNNEAELKYHAKKLELIVNRYKNHPSLETWWLINEPAHGPIKTTFALQLYRKWLQKKYGTIEQLNKAWQRNFTSPLKNELPSDFSAFDQIEYSPSWEKAGWNYVEFYDWYRFSADNITWILQWIADEIKKYDTSHEVHVNPHNVFGNLIQYDFPAWRKFLTTLGASIHPSWHFGILKPEQFALGVAASCEIVKGSSEPNPFWISELQGGNNIWSGGRPLGPEANDIAQWTWTGIGTGAEKIIYWMLSKRTKTGESGDWSLLDFQGNPSDRMQMAASIAETIEKEKDFFAGATTLKRQIAILISRETMITMLRKNSKDTLVARGPNAHIFTALSYYQALSALGIPATFKFIEDFDWENKKDFIAILPNATTIANATAKQAETFVANGNKLIIDGLSGYYNSDEVNTPQVGYLFEQLCGATYKDIRVEENIHEIGVAGTTDSLPVCIWQIEILNKTGKVISKSGNRVLAVRNNYGKGEVVWMPQLAGLGAWLSDSRTFTNWLQTETKAIGESQPIVFSKQSPNVVMSVLENKGTYVTIITNGNNQSAKVSLKQQKPLSATVLFNTHSQPASFASPSFLLQPKQTIVLKWKPVTSIKK